MLIVSCCNYNGGIFTIDENTLEVKKVVNEEARGIAFSGNRLFACNFGALNVYDENFDLVEKRINVNDWHGLQVHENKIFVVSPKEDVVKVFDPKLNLINSIDLREGKEGRNHINDLFFVNGYMYFSMFSQIAKTDYKNGNGCIKRFDYISTETVQIGLKEPHTPHVYENELYCCNSQLGELIKGNQILFRTDSYTRGVLITDDYYYIGLSKYRHDKGRGRCGILRRNRTGNEETFIPLPADEVYTIVRREQ